MTGSSRRETGNDRDLSGRIFLGGIAVRDSGRCEVRIFQLRRPYVYQKRVKQCTKKDSGGRTVGIFFRGVFENKRTTFPRRQIFLPLFSLEFS